MSFISPKLRQSARGEECTFQIAGICSHDAERTVLAHIRDESKGMGNKADDWSAAFACDKCHEAIDQHRLPVEEERFYCLRALQRTWRRWVARGLIVVTGLDPETVKTRPKKPGNWPKGRKLQSANNLRKQA